LAIWAQIVTHTAYGSPGLEQSSSRCQLFLKQFSRGVGWGPYRSQRWERSQRHGIYQHYVKCHRQFRSKRWRLLKGLSYGSFSFGFVFKKSKVVLFIRCDVLFFLFGTVYFLLNYKFRLSLAKCFRIFNDFPKPSCCSYKSCLKASWSCKELF
jgi:hypothetical protein